jgi:hypothetical protein
VFLTSLATKVSSGFEMFVVVVEISTFEFCSHFLFFVRAQPVMPGVNKKRWRSPYDTQAASGTTINLGR